jgi:hypothetical protein
MKKVQIWTLGIVFCALAFTLGGCKIYSFTGANISSDIKTVTVEIFENRAPNAPASYNQTLTDQLKLKLVSEASLKQVSNQGDVVFKGYVVSYGVVALAPTAQVQTGVNRLSITVHVDFVNTKDEKDKWSKDFTRFAEFPATELLSSRENQLITEINKQFIDDIFNDAFAKW